MGNETQPGNALQHLNELCGVIKTLKRENTAFQQTIQDNRAASKLKTEGWNEQFERLQVQVRDGTISIGDKFDDYVFGNYTFYPTNWATFGEKTKELSNMLNEAFLSRSFWHHKKERLQPETQIYTFSRLNGEHPYTLTPSQITLNSTSSVEITLEPVFNDGAIWAFLKAGSGGQINVRPERAKGKWDDVILTKENCSEFELEKMLESNPVALKGFKKLRGLPVIPELQVMAESYTEKVALAAVNALKKAYADVRESDKKIIEIEKRYDSPQEITEMFATRPVILDDKPDLFLAKIMSYEHDTKRNCALQSLAKCMYDLRRTGLEGYSESIEVPKRAGETIVYNLAEFAKYIRNILELSIETKEKTRETAEVGTIE